MWGGDIGGLIGDPKSAHNFQLKSAYNPDSCDPY